MQSYKEMGIMLELKDVLNRLSEFKDLKITIGSYGAFLIEAEGLMVSTFTYNVEEGFLEAYLALAAHRKYTLAMKKIKEALDG